MSGGVQGFVQGKNPRPASPAFPPQIRDRRDAASLKLPFPKAKKPSNTAPSAFGYSSNGYGERNNYLNQQYVPQPEPLPAQAMFGQDSYSQAQAQPAYSQEVYVPEQSAYAQERGQFDETIASDFDKTITDAGSYNGQQVHKEDDHDDYGDEEAEPEYNQQFNAQRSPGYPKHLLNHKHSQVHLGATINERQVELPTRSQAPTRFVKPHRELEVRTTNSENMKDHENQVPKKRSRSVERKPVSDEYNLRLPGNVAADQENDQDPESPTPASQSQRKGRLSSQAPVSRGPVTGGKDHISEDTLNDYTDEELKTMQYSTLAKQPWETFPHQRQFTLAPTLRNANTSLGDKITYYVLHENEYRTKGIEVNDRDDETPNFFAELSTEEWDEAGDWFLNKFSDLMNQLRQKRVQKRELTAKFEKEIQRREKAVRGKSDNLDRKFAGMRASGEDMLRGKMA